MEAGGEAETVMLFIIPRVPSPGQPNRGLKGDGTV